jgi:hypothetical protein
MFLPWNFAMVGQRNGFTTPQSLIDLPVIQILGIEGVAAQFDRRGNDRTVPVGDLVALADGQCGPENGFGDW